jgi:hypothetical protein
MKIKLILIILILIVNNLFVIQYIKKNDNIESNRQSSVAGNISQRETLILKDNSTVEQRLNKPKLKPVELGFYNYGAGIFTENMFEFWTSGTVSFASHKVTPNIELRDKTDAIAGLWLNGSGRIGSQRNKIQMYIGNWSGGEENENSSDTIYVGQDNKVTNDSFQFTFNENGILEVKKDIIINGKSVLELLYNKKCTDK